MLDFLKRFGLGILYVLTSPFVLLFLVLWAIYNLGLFFIEIGKGIVSFFKGQKLFPEFPEDVEAKRILSLEPFSNNEQPATNNNPQPVNNPNPTNSPNNEENKPL